MKPRTIDGVSLNKQNVTDLRENLITYRNNELAATNFEKAVILSLIIAIMAHYIELLDE